MGCGASKAVNTYPSDQNNKQTNPQTNQKNLNSHFPPNNSLPTPAPTYPNYQSYPHNNPQVRSLQEFNGYSPQESLPSNNLYFQAERLNPAAPNFSNQANIAFTTLPSPQPPSSKKEDLLKETKNWKVYHDPRQIPPSQTQSLDNFTADTLLPPGLIKKTVYEVPPNNFTSLSEPVSSNSDTTAPPATNQLSDPRATTSQSFEDAIVSESQDKSPESREKRSENQKKQPENQDIPPESQDKPPESQIKPPENQDIPPESQEKTPENQGIPPEGQDKPPESQDKTPESQIKPPENQDIPPESQEKTPENQGIPPEGQDKPPESQDKPPFEETQDKTPVKKAPKGTVVPIITTASYEDQVQHHINELHEQKRKMKEKRETDKGKSQQILKEKLKRRSEQKKKQRQESAALANGLSVDTSDTKIGESGDEQQIRDLTLEPSAVEPAPQPSIPETKKEVLYSEENIELFHDLEDYAVSMKKSTDDILSFADLMENLLIAQLSDLEKVRILFHWITAQDLNAINFPLQMDEDTPLGFLYAIKQDKKTYSALFVRLCGAAGLHAKLILGYLKGVGYFPDYKFQGKNDPFRGSWNGVLVDGQWRLIDTNWGARHVTEEEGGETETWRTEYKYEEHYFLTDPDQLINTHFPDEQEWQLLQSPISLESFEKTPKLWPLFYKLKLQLRTHMEGVIEADTTGYVKFQLGVSAFARTDAKFKAELKPRFKESQSEIVELQKYLFHNINDDVETFEIFLPKPGQYLFKIYGMSKTFGEENSFTNVCFYLINCSALTSRPATMVQPPFPIVGTNYGTSIVSSQLIARPLIPLEPIVNCDENGEATLRFKIVSNDKDISFAFDLLDSNLNAENKARVVDNSVVYSVSEQSGEKELFVFVRVPRKENFALALYSNFDNPSSNSFQPFGFYLLNTSKFKHPQKPSLPPVPNSRIGMLQPGFNDLSLTIKSFYPADNDLCKAGIVTTDTNGEFTIVFSHQEPLTLISELSNSNSEDFNNFTSVETTGKVTAVTVRPSAQASDNGLVFCLKVYAGKLDHVGGFPSIFVAMVFARNQIDIKNSLPQSPSRVWGPSGATFTKNGVKSVTFHNSSSCLTKVLNEQEVNLHGPTRVYNGGEDFEIHLEMTNPLRIKTKIQGTDQSNDENFENFVFLDKVNASFASIRVRFIKTGTFFVVVYGSKIEDDSGQLPPLVYSLVHVTSPSKCTVPFPISFNAWGSSACQLVSPLQLQLPKNENVAIKIYLAKYEPTASGWTTVPYPDVMAMVDESNPVPLTSSSNCEYEWNFVSGPGEKVFGILARPEQGADSLTYVLQFKID